MGTLHDVADGYDFEDSTAIHENTFVGLAIDEDNQDDMTEERVETWIESIKPYFIKNLRSLYSFHNNPKK